MLIRVWIGRHLHKHIPGNPTVVVDNMAGSLLRTRFPFDRNRTSKTQQKGTCRRFYQYDPPCVQIAPTG